MNVILPKPHPTSHPKGPPIPIARPPGQQQRPVVDDYDLDPGLVSDSEENYPVSVLLHYSLTLSLTISSALRIGLSSIN